MYAIVHVPAPRRVTTAAVVAGVPVFVVSPATEQTAGVVVENATTKPESALAVIPNDAPPKVFVEIEPNVMVCAVLLTVSEFEVTDPSPSAENVSV